MPLRSEQYKVVFGAVCAVAVATAVAYASYHSLDLTVMGLETAEERLVFAVKGIPFLMVPLLAMIAHMGSYRFFHETAISGASPADDIRYDIHQRVLRNTIEQTLLAIPAFMGLAVWLSPQALGLVPGLATLFVFARFAFWWGYLRGARAFGFALTFYPLAGIYSYLLWKLFAAHHS